MPPPTFSRPPGFYDRTASESAVAAAVVATMQGAMSRFGYQVVETPLVEFADLFLTKSGDESISRLFTFEMHGRQLCLRSEFTPSAARLYVERYQHEPRPVRWQFAGPVFRYESPQRSHSRQFTMLGAELIGPSGVGGDAEAMGLAAQGLFALGLRDWTLVIGHVGLIGQLLDRFGLDRHIRRFVLGQLENLRRPDRGRAYVEQQLGRLYAGAPPSLESPEAAQLTAQIATGADQDNVSQVLQMFLASANLGTTGTGRTNEDIARRLLNRQRRAAQHGRVLRALDFLESLLGIQGDPDQAFSALDALLPEDEAIHSTVHSFRAALDLLPAYGIAPDQISLQLGLARGLNYYTGIVFEAHTQVGDSLSQLCGGGRYDDFVRVLGAAQDTPAIGFAYGLERILHEVRRNGQTIPDVGVQALVVPVEDSDNAEAARVAMALRAQVDTELFTPPTLNLSQALARANKQDIPYVIIVGAAERASGKLSVRDMRAETQLSAPLEEIIDLVAGRDQASD